MIVVGAFPKHADVIKMRQITLNEDEEFIKEEARTTKKIVEEILKNDERARNDDIWLLIRVWREQGKKIYISANERKGLISPETITRVRRKIQNDEGKYVPTDAEIVRRRGIKEKVYQEIMAGDFSG